MSAERIAAIHDYVEALGTALAQWDGLRTRPPPAGPGSRHRSVDRQMPIDPGTAEVLQAWRKARLAERIA
jgi:hypothetical protein